MVAVNSCASITRARMNVSALRDTSLMKTGNVLVSRDYNEEEKDAYQ